ncbi:TBC1 domain family member 4 isoform X2 [Galleria mellonella]|uniref:TBC1 domain family member 4 isoform X2 n=1 Tax=Galleria mellonella TaxID=7137 RepID=A0ABM3MCU1_GALME|nr:TBC1 domain family member 4 isoform X2 [Galleria mellonella]
MNHSRPIFGSHSDTSAINLKHLVTDLFGQMREPSPGAPSPKDSSGSLANGAVTKNIGFQQQNTSELPWSSPAISLPGNCNNNLTSEPQSGLVRSVSNASTLTSLCADLSPSDSHFFEVLYIGKVRISQRKVPDSLIDDALNKFAQHEAEKIKNQRRHSLHPTSTETSVHSNTENLADEKEKLKSNLGTSSIPLEPDKSIIKKTKVENNEIDKEFDMFTKERVEINSQMRKSQTLESMSLNISKNNLGTVTEDEEKHDIQSIITKTASSITKFCEHTIKDVNKIEDNIIEEKSPISENNKENTEIDKNENSSRQFTDQVSNKQEVNESGSEKNSSENKQSLNLSIEKFNKLSSSKMLNSENIKKSMLENKPYLRDRSASIGTLNLKTPIVQLIGEQNRTMLFQVGRSELRLISPDRKQILLHRAFKDVASCVLGRINKDHFGFVCREANDSYACYVFKCESDSVATEVVNAIKQAFLAHAELLKKSREKSPNMTCEHCPMLWYHRLCHDIEGMNEKKTHAFILRRIEQLPDDEQDVIITKYQGGTNHMYEVSEHNAFLMMLLRAHSEAKQLRHIHDTAENRSEFLNQYLGGSTIFMKAKRSLSSSFDHLLKRKSSKDEAGLGLPQVSKKEASPLSTTAVETPSEPHTAELHPPESSRSKSQSPAARTQSSDSPSSPKQLTPPAREDDSVEKEEPGTPVNSPMMDIFLKVNDSRPTAAESGTETDATWRQAIYEKVVQPPELQTEGELSSKKLLSIPTAPQGKRSKEQLRQLWKLAIDQTILLVRMEKENARLKESEESSAVRRIKLEYAELGVCDAGVVLMWDSLLSSRDSSRQMAKVDKHMLTQAVIQGVPRTCRGGVWWFLAEQAALQAAPPPAAYHAPYRTLLAGLTKHQHAILIDLGRTFPKHSYFASALGPGQLALYNILKAYSLLDPEVGYCQGLSFVAGVLLLHTEEAEAFGLLRHLMFRRGLRKQYLPDMSALQVQLYQLSRLLRDHEPELHAKLESLDISPALYAAPWMLTLFTSQFPLGFVVRVFDLIFLDSFDVVFSISLALLSIHRDGLMLCESCEEAAEYLKHKMPDMDKGIYEKVMKKIHSLDISRQLNDYAVEYAVLREEMPRLATLTEENRHLLADNKRMSDELDSAMDAITNYQKVQARLETQNKTMEQQLTLLSRYMSAYHRQEMPPEIKKIIQTYSKKISFSSKISSFSSKFTSNDDEEEKKIFKTGLSAPNLFSKISREEVLNAANIEKKPAENERKFLMKKSQSVHSGLIGNNLKNYPLRVLDEKSELDQKKDTLNDNLQELGRKNSGFFASTHEQIRQERLFEQQLKHDFDENLKRFDERNTSKSFTDDLSLFQSRKTMSLNLNSATKTQEVKLNDSGFVTPLSPNETDRRDDCASTISHPLSDCDVDIIFDGQSTKLKQLGPIKQPNSITDK